MFTLAQFESPPSVFISFAMSLSSLKWEILLSLFKLKTYFIFNLDLLLCPRLVSTTFSKTKAKAKAKAYPKSNPNPNPNPKSNPN